MWRGGLGTEILGSAKSALGHKQTRHSQMVMSALPPKADIRPRDRNDRFGPKADILAAVRYDGWPSSRGIAMKLPRRKFLNLAMGATALSALSDTALALDAASRRRGLSRNSPCAL